MPMDIERNNIIFLALLYNYLANHEMNLSEYKVLKFVEIVTDNLKEIDSNFKITATKDESDLFYLYNIRFDKEKEQYFLTDLSEVEFRFNYQLIELVTASLQINALSSIGVSKENLKFEKYYKYKSGIEDIYSLEAKRAKAIAKEILENQGCINVEIGTAIPDQLESDKGYHVYYTCEEPVEKLKVLVNGSKK